MHGSPVHSVQSALFEVCTVCDAGEHGHFRKGQAGDWRNHLSEAQRRRFEAVLRRRLAGTGLEGTFDDARD